MTQSLQRALRASGRRLARGAHTPGCMLLFAFTTLILVFFILFAGYEFIFRDRVILGVSVFGQSMRGLTRTEARKFLQTQFGQKDAMLARAGGELVVLRDGDHTWSAHPWELGLRTDFDPVADSAVLLGHRGTLSGDLIEQARCFLLGCDLSLDAQFDSRVALAYLEALAPQVNRAPVDASVHIDGVSVVSAPAQNGRELDTAVMLEQMRKRVLGIDQGELVLAFQEKKPSITNADSAKAQAEAILSAPVFLTFSGRTWALDRGALSGMLTIQAKQDASGSKSLTATLDHAKVVAYLTTVARDINQPARDARFHFDPSTHQLTVIRPSQNGETLDPEAAAKAIEQQLLASGPGQKSSAGARRPPGNASLPADLSVRTISLPVTTTKPAVAMEDAANFGIKELVSQGVSNFRGSAAGRVQNIKTATEQFDGIVIPPGSTFSFDQYLGDVVEANGYDDAYVIFKDQTVLGPGGGVCQVSTTLFRAAFWGGFPIVERWAHAYRVGYYEPPVGLDATVFAPTVDMKFTNDTPNYLLIEPSINVKTTTLTFNLYGTKPNRTVEMTDPVQDKIVPHGPPLYTNDPTLKQGVTKQVDFAHDGMDVTIWRTITVDGQVVKKDKFFSRYQPWVARYMVGTKP